MKKHCAIAGAVMFALSLAQSGACAAADLRTALNDAACQLTLGDVNADGLPDLIAVGTPKIITLSLDDDMPAIPIRIPPSVKNFALISAGRGQYALTTGPGQATIDAARNRSSARPAFGDLTGSAWSLVPLS